MNYLLPFLIFFPMISGIIGYTIGLTNKTRRDYYAWMVTGLVLIGCLLLTGPQLQFTIGGACGLGLHLKTDGFRVILAILTGFVWFVTTVFSKEYFSQGRNRNRYYLFMLLTLGATLGVFLSADLFTTLVFFEIMSFTSYVLVIHEEDEEAIQAGHTYLAVAVLGGLVTLMGLFLLYQWTGTLQMDELTKAIAKLSQEQKQPYYFAGLLVLFGFGAKAGMFPIHTWLPAAYPAAPAPASALLSCILSKTGLFGIIVLSGKIFLHDGQWGMIILILGVLTMVVGAMLAVFSINLKRTLACSSMSQIGFILVGIGMQGLLGHHNALAVDGSLLHLLNHTLVKLVLFVSAGIIFMNTGVLDLNKIRGYGRKKPLLKGIFLMGLLGVGGIPLWNGYISKTLIHESIVEYIVLLQESGQSITFFKTVESLFLCAGGLTLAYMTKLFVAIFIEKNPEGKFEEKEAYISKPTAILLTACGAILPIFGILPHATLDFLVAYGRSFMSGEGPAHAIHYFSWVNLQGAVISVVVGAIVYFVIIRRLLMKKDKNDLLVYVDRWPSWFDLEQLLYRPVLLKLLPFVGAFFARFAGSLVDWVIAFFKNYIYNNDHGKVIPPEDAYFSFCTHEAGEGSGFREGLAKSLLLFGLGVTIAMLYMLF